MTFTEIVIKGVSDTIREYVRKSRKNGKLTVYYEQNHVVLCYNCMNMRANNKCSVSELLVSPIGICRHFKTDRK